jgi:error-prone DNA polymerase
MRLAKGLPEADARRIERAVRECGRFATIESLWRAGSVSARAVRALANADAFASMGMDRRAALWQSRALRDDRLPLFEQTDATDDTGLDRLPVQPPDRAVLHDYDATGLSLKAHPMSFVRDHLAGEGVIPAGDLRDQARCPAGRSVAVAGLVLCRQRPGTASGVVFITLEDETGIANLVIWKDTFERQRAVLRLSTALLVRGTIERQGEVVHIHVREASAIDPLLPGLAARSRNFH